MAGIPEYWLVDPVSQRVTVFVLDGETDRYTVHELAKVAQRAWSVTLPGFSIELQASFAPAP